MSMMSNLVPNPFNNPFGLVREIKTLFFCYLGNRVVATIIIPIYRSIVFYIMDSVFCIL